MAKKLPTILHQPRSHLCTVPKAPTNCWTSSLVAEVGRFLTWSRLLFLQQLTNTLLYTVCCFSGTEKEAKKIKRLRTKDNRLTNTYWSQVQFMLPPIQILVIFRKDTWTWQKLLWCNRKVPLYTRALPSPWTLHYSKSFSSQPETGDWYQMLWIYHN